MTDAERQQRRRDNISDFERLARFRRRLLHAFDAFAERNPQVRFQGVVDCADDFKTFLILTANAQTVDQMLDVRVRYLRGHYLEPEQDTVIANLLKRLPSE